MNLIVTRADNNIKSMTDITIPLFKEYAKKIGADFKTLSHQPPILSDDNKTHYRIIEVGNLLNDYDRVLCLDADMIINKDCPNIFELVPEDMIGSIYEDKGSRKPDRIEKISVIQRTWGDVGWKENYTNAGTFLVSKMHKNIFLPVHGTYWTAWGSADLHLSYNIHKYNFKVFELEYKWNHMTMFSEPWNNHADRFKSYIIHYAGGGIFEEGRFRNRLDQIRSDYNQIYG